MLDGLPTGWAHDLWEAAKTAGPFGNLLLFVILLYVSRMYRNERNLNQSYAERVFTLAESTKGALETNTHQISGNTAAIETFKDVVLKYLLDGNHKGASARRK